MKKVIVVWCLFLLATGTFGQSLDSCFYLQVDLANRWVWRGVSYSEAPLLQPSLGFTNEKWNFLIWGSYPFERRAYSEIDFTVEYQLTKQIKLGVTDFFGINDSIGAKHDFFNFRRKTTMHMLDAYFVVAPLKKIPLSVITSLWFWGADRKAITLDQNFSSYMEVKYEKEFNLYKAGVFAGMTFGDGFYAHKAAVVNTGVSLSKNMSVGNAFSIPIRMEFVVNPELGNTYINAIVTLK